MSAKCYFCSFLFLLLSSLLPVGPVRAQDGEDPAPAKDETPEIHSGLVSALKFRGIGPALMSGRVLDIAVDPVKRSTWYLATVGGVWKTENAGTTWKSIFDGYGSYSIGCVTIDPNDRFTLWVGTGENNSQRSVGYGDGVYKSTDGGSSFQKVGLPDSEHIGKIVVHPDNSKVVYVAAQGPLWKEGGDRGLYQTTDGGKTWKRILNISENTGINEVHMDPENPQILYASSYQRRRHTWVLIDGGPESGIHKSIDGGQTWKPINRGLPGGDKGRIGMAVSPINPEIVYAVVEAADGESGFYRSSNRGESWSRMGNYVSGSPQYYQEIVACPHRLDRVYSLDTYLQVSEDGGRNFSPLGEADKHVDNHALVIDPADPDHLIVGCDGGVYESWDRGTTYDFKANLPITQFYKVAVSNERPFYYVYGGTQDNATQGGPSRTNNIHGIRNSDWFITVFGDGFDPAVDPSDPDTIYSQWQYGGLVRFNRKTGERVDIKPQPAAGGPALRWNWDSALLISPHNHRRIYYGSQVLFCSDDRGNSWKAISGDLSRNLDRNQLKVMGRVWSVDAVAKNMSTSMYGTIVSVSESPKQEGLIYAGTDDGLLQVTSDGGKKWTAISRFGDLPVPEFGYINDVEASVHDADTVFVAINNHKRGDFKPYIVKSTDRGKTWQNLTGNLPQRGSVYCLKQDPVNADLLFCGTEFGCYFSVDGGQKWVRLSAGLPTVCIRDIEIQEDENDLVLASFGRGFFILDDYSPLRKLSRETVKQDAVFPIRTGKMYAEIAPLAVGTRAFQGANFFTAPNPPYGVTITYHLKESLQTKKGERKSKEAKLKAAGKDVPFPSWDAFREEDREQAGRVYITIRDAAGKAIRRLNASSRKGMHRVQWDFRHAGVGTGRGRRGPVAVPGKYTAEIHKFDQGKETLLVKATPFEIQPLLFGDMTSIDRKAIVVFAKKAQALGRQVNKATELWTETGADLEKLVAEISSDPLAEQTQLAALRKLQLEWMDIGEIFNGDPTRSRRNESALPGLSGRLRTLTMGAMGSTEGPTDTHKSQYSIVESQLAEANSKLRVVATRVALLIKAREK
ncbi:MAG: glycosyl hydrolase [Planctomycetota bacterium]|nr:glycosyl hydrolase [Planctomycetota bacterium]